MCRDGELIERFSERPQEREWSWFLWQSHHDGRERAVAEPAVNARQVLLADDLHRKPRRSMVLSMGNMPTGEKLPSRLRFVQ
jgi:hypothetical protein